MQKRSQDIDIREISARSSVSKPRQVASPCFDHWEVCTTIEGNSSACGRVINITLTHVWGIPIWAGVVYTHRIFKTPEQGHVRGTAWRSHWPCRYLARKRTCTCSLRYTSGCTRSAALLRITPRNVWGTDTVAMLSNIAIVWCTLACSHGA